MWIILAQGTAETVVLGGASGVIVLILSMFIKNRYAIKVGPENGNKAKNGDYATRPVWCEIMHEALDKQQSDRHAELLRAIDKVEQTMTVEIKPSITKLHERIDEMRKPRT